MDISKFNQNIDEKSSSSASFFCISALERPPVTKIVLTVTKIVIIAAKPKSAGSKRRAKIMVTTNVTKSEDARSNNFQAML